MPVFALTNTAAMNSYTLSNKKKSELRKDIENLVRSSNPVLFLAPIEE